VNRRILRSIVPCVAVACFSMMAQSAPGPKDTEKPLPPATPEQRLTSTNNLKMIGLAMHNYHDTNGTFPTNYMTKDGKPGLSWRVALLPYMEEDKLFREFKLDEAWDSAHNAKLIERIPKVYTSVRGRAEKDQTFYQMFAGDNTLLGAGKGIRLQDTTDGTSNTFMAVEGGKPVVWTKPEDLTFDGKQVPKLGGMFDGDFHVVMGDGSVRLIPKGINSDVIKAAITRNGGEVFDLIDAVENSKKKE
jgi:hypothetical protein